MPPDRAAAILGIGCGHGAILYARAAGEVAAYDGFARVVAYEDRPIAHGFTSGVRAALWRLIRAALLFYIAVETGSLNQHTVLSQNLLAVAWVDK